MNVIPQVQTYTCPCCHGYIGEAAPIDAVLERVARGQQKTILELLSRRVGKTVAKDTVLSLLFDDRADGGPDNAGHVLAVQIFHLRKFVGAYGWSIVTTGGGRGASTFYRLIPTEAGA
ncbi:hypothetical protein QO002_002158 [Pararhizobium capsulatum DSM 1112]|uniref:Uncharacterized protein n=1 Tax=Pararhizobium capsulatum DSM 1112 TaxID=1121113 RepID=A0ABU0BP48_9HYPH|nr:hypothetical protein [Pararhizobium capsulatum]MDQ0320020.1 hypothetical protein [Pararhizobium capsulatum DSM 1112]